MTTTIANVYADGTKYWYINDKCHRAERVLDINEEDYVRPVFARTQTNIMDVVMPIIVAESIADIVGDLL